MSVCSYTANFLQCSFVFSVVVAHARGFNLKLFLLCVPGFSKHAAAKIFVDFAILVFWFFEFLCFFVLHFILFFYFICIYFYILLTFASLTPFTGSLQTCLNYLFTRAASHSFALLIFSPYFCLHSALLLCCCLFFFLMIFASFLRLYKNILIKIHFWAFAYERELRCFNCSAVVVTVVFVMFLFCCACGKNCCDLLI